jgi:UDP:flavonoid glycosyltransferase YjiC (YdhE family)
MSRLLIATVPLTGHVHPMALMVRALIERGHECYWYAGRKFEPTIAQTGARFVPMRSARDWDDADIDASIPALRGRRGIARVKIQLREMFVAPMVDQLRDLEALVDELSPAAIVADSAHLGATLLSEKRGIPLAGLGISALMLPSVDTAPFGPGFPPTPGNSARVRNRIMNWLVHRVLFGAINRAYRRRRVDAGLPGGTGTYFEVCSPYLYLQPTIPAFEYPRSDLPSQVHFIGPLVPRELSRDAALPAWWSDLEDAKRRGVPTVLVTQGTLATDERDLIAPSLRALADQDVMVVVTGRVDAGSELPRNARHAPYVPYQALLPYVSVVVTNAGYGGVQMALRHGVPIVAAGGSEEKPEIAARIAWSGAGIDLRTGRPPPAAVRAAVRKTLDDDRFRRRARELGDEMATYDAPARGAELIEALVDRRAPIPRPGA